MANCASSLAIPLFTGFWEVTSWQQHVFFIYLLSYLNIYIYISKEEIIKKKKKKHADRDFPGSSVQNLLSNAGDRGSIPDSRKITHVMGQLSPWARNCWACAPELVLCNTREVTVMRRPCTATRQSVHSAVKTQCGQNKNKQTGKQFKIGNIPTRASLWSSG